MTRPQTTIYAVTYRVRGVAARLTRQVAHTVHAPGGDRDLSIALLLSTSHDGREVTLIEVNNA